MSINATIKSIQDIMRKDVGVDGDTQRIGQLGWMLFDKKFSDQDQELELSDDENMVLSREFKCFTDDK